jgi:7-cyano-7-deazaguanine synthase
MKVVVLVSGGIDSVTALHHAHKDHHVVGALSFDYGSKHNPRELPQATWHANKLGVPHRTIRLSFINDLFVSDLLRSGGEIPEGHYEEASMKKTVVPFRNGIMLSIAAGYAESCEADALVIAAHAGDHAIYPDCREEFMSAMASAVQFGTYSRIQLMRPFIHWNKAEIVVRGATLGVNFSHTWSCYKGGQRHCGKCGTCVERREAFIRAGVPDPTDYVAQTPLPKAPRTTRRVKVTKST